MSSMGPGGPGLVQFININAPWIVNHDSIFPEAESQCPEISASDLPPIFPIFALSFSHDSLPSALAIAAHILMFAG